MKTILIPTMPSRQHKTQAHADRADALGEFGTTAFGAFKHSASSTSYLAERPELSGLPDPNLVVSFKNLAKKDDTTRTKALEDVQTYVSNVQAGNSVVDDGFFEAWVSRNVALFPRACLLDRS